MDERKKMIDEFMAKPSKYDVDVLDNSMLPEKLKERPTISFVVKPPTINTLGQMARVLFTLPDDLMVADDINPTEALKYLDEMVKIFCIMSWGKKEEYPEWYEPFLKANLQGNEMFKLFKEMAMKAQTDFFLPSLKMLNASNPMTMDEFDQEDSTPTNSSDK